MELPYSGLKVKINTSSVQQLDLLLSSHKNFLLLKSPSLLFQLVPLLLQPLRLFLESSRLSWGKRSREKVKPLLYIGGDHRQPWLSSEPPSFPTAPSWHSPLYISSPALPPSSPGQRGPFAAGPCHQRSWNHFPDVEQAKDGGLEVKEQKYLLMLKRDL